VTVVEFVVAPEPMVAEPLTLVGEAATVKFASPRLIIMWEGRGLSIRTTCRRCT
jgi:hypothetical protein